MSTKSENKEDKSENSKEALENVEIYVPIPTDDPYGWIVVFAAFVSNCVVDGFIYNFGILMSQLQVYFSSTKAEVAMIMSFQGAMYYFIGPITSALLNRLGFRVTGWLGACLVAISFFSSSYCTSVQSLILTFGVLSNQLLFL